MSKPDISTDRVDRRVWIIAAACACGPLMSGLDSTMVNVSLDTLGTAFGASLGTIQWVTTGYLLALALSLPLSGWLMSSAAGVSVFWFGYIPLPDLVPRDPTLFDALRTTHYILSRLLIAVLALHVGAVVHHDVLRRDGVFRRMWPFGGT